MAARKHPPPPTQEAHRTNALLEDIRAQQQVMLEAIASMREELERKFGERFDGVDTRLKLLEESVRSNSAEIRKNSEDIRRLFGGLAEVSDEVRRLRADFDRREERSRIEALEARVERLELHLKVG